MTEQSIDFVVERVSEVLGDVGFEIHPFKIGWYNSRVEKPFVLPYEPDTLAILVISVPNMFEKAFVPYLQGQECVGGQDSIDQCVAHYFTLVKQKCKDIAIEAIHDFELHHSRRPKVLVQTAGHVSGACYYYRRCDVIPDPWGDKKKIYGVSVHPKYGGWFALRGILIFKDVLCPDLVRKEPVDIVASRESRIELLERFNNNWQDWTFRDIVPVTEKYSQDQKEYFATPPSQRTQLIQALRSKFLSQ